MASTDVIREAAMYLEYFLKGMSDCSVIGSYTVQFLEMKSFSMRLQTSLATHLVQLVTNMKGLLLKLDNSLLPVCNAEVQTENRSMCSLCSCQGSVHIPVEDTKDRSVAAPQGKSYESPELVQLLTSTPLIQLKQEITCVSDSVASGSSQYHQVEMAVSNVDLKDVKCKGTLKTSDNRLNTESQIEKCVVTPSLHTHLDEHMELDYAASSHLQEETQGEILLDNLEGSDGTQPSGLMYSVYTMNPCGSLQLVSRVLSKSSSSRDSLDEPVERATIRINNMKEDDHRTQSQLESLTLRGEEIQTSEPDINLEEMVVAPDILGFEEKQLKSASKRKSRKIVASQMSPAGTILTDIVKTINSEEEMCDHVRDCHGNLPFICVVCGQSLRTNAAFQRHMDIHKGLRGSACEICGQTFSRTEYYREHKRIHTGEKPYECDTCKKTFRRSSNLYTHMRIHNIEEQRHICKACNKSFARADKLKDHMIRHLQIKRYACRLCPKAYNEKRDLTKHLEKVHTSHNNVDT
ncbi:Myoneurin-like 5 [Homarus americanus]|uniref:Myoneurin-like 5 n=1 Tax=Homarus americanus TaxID=6706 RepID=A0A8J5JK82_HOMAM|nr:Myoneurin-like 5 [Homarus americanus]